VELLEIQRFGDLLFSMSHNRPTMLALEQWELQQALFRVLREMLSISYGFAEVHQQLMKQL
jgi:hypothetical protein